ncbi:hypothetical protein YN1_1450 [Nanoarchaeota archaeon]
MKVYYDTYPAIAFSIKKIKNHAYSPYSENITPYISIIGIEEALHILFSRERYKDEWYPNMSKSEAYEKFIEDMMSIYKIIDIKENKQITIKYLNIIGALNKSIDYINNVKIHSSVPGFNDLLHFSISDLICEVFLTTDSSFKTLEKVKTENIKEIVILDEKDLSIEKEINLIDRDSP